MNTQATSTPPVSIDRLEEIALLLALGAEGQNPRRIENRVTFEFDLDSETAKALNGFRRGAGPLINASAYAMCLTRAKDLVFAARRREGV